MSDLDTLTAPLRAARSKAFRWLQDFCTAEGAPEDAGIAFDAWAAEVAQRKALQAECEGLRAAIAAAEAEKPTPQDLQSPEYWRGYAAGVKAPHTEAEKSARRHNDGIEPPRSGRLE